MSNFKNYPFVELNAKEGGIKMIYLANTPNDNTRFVIIEKYIIDLNIDSDTKFKLGRYSSPIHFF